MRCRGSSVVGRLVAVGFLVCSAEARATPPRARLVYGRSADAIACPDEAALRRAVASRLGYDPFFPWAPQTVVVGITGQRGRLSGRFELVDDQGATHGARIIDAAGKDCAALVDTLALTITIALDPQALARAAPPSETAEAPEPTPITPPVVAQSVAPPSASPGESPRPTPSRTRNRVDGPSPELSVDTRAAVGVEPSFAAGLFVGGALAWRHIALGVGGGSYLPAGTRGGDGSDVRGWLVAVEAAPCALLSPFRLCGIATAGRFEGWSTAGGRSDTGTFVAAGARGAVDIVRGERVALSFSGDVLGNVNPMILRVGGAEAWRAPRVLISAGPSARISF